MTIIDRYIFKVVLGTALIALLVLLALEIFLTFLAELEDLGVGNYGVVEILKYVLLILPGLAYQTFPMALLLGGLLGMGTLASGSELMVMRAAGLSVLRLIWATLKVGLLLGLVAMALSEFVAPPAERSAQELRSTAKASNIAIREGRGFWAKDGNHFIQVRSVLPDARLADIHIYEMGQASELNAVIQAQSAHYQDGHWVLERASRRFLQPERVTTAQLDSLVIEESVINPDMLDVLAADPEDLAMRDLLIYIDYLKANGLDAKDYQLAFWSKMLTPFSNLAMLFVAMPFVFSSQRQIGMGQRLLIGIGLGLLFFLGNRLIGNLVLLYGYPPWLGASLPTLLFFAGGAYGLRKMR